MDTYGCPNVNQSTPQVNLMEALRICTIKLETLETKRREYLSKYPAYTDSPNSVWMELDTDNWSGNTLDVFSGTKIKRNQLGKPMIPVIPNSLNDSVNFTSVIKSVETIVYWISNPWRLYRIDPRNRQTLQFIDAYPNEQAALAGAKTVHAYNTATMTDLETHQHRNHFLYNYDQLVHQI